MRICFSGSDHGKYLRYASIIRSLLTCSRSLMTCSRSLLTYDRSLLTVFMSLSNTFGVCVSQRAVCFDAHAAGSTRAVLQTHRYI